MWANCTRTERDASLSTSSFTRVLRIGPTVYGLQVLSSPKATESFSESSSNSGPRFLSRPSVLQRKNTDRSHQEKECVKVQPFNENASGIVYCLVTQRCRVKGFFLYWSWPLAFLHQSVKNNWRALLLIVNRRQEGAYADWLLSSGSENRGKIFANTAHSEYPLKSFVIFSTCVITLILFKFKCPSAFKMFPADIFCILSPLNKRCSSYNAVNIYYTTRGVKQKDNTQQVFQKRI